ncbi:uncharacterized protein C8Q71DRAFT_824894 [Rhodofomes roseus]|uniref:Smr domain-containing protein n=1 Tax=Rhodofomes roseus TaxID=34475 RepID=A0ABQ8K0P8_9APHY|nr:uncharacterized protein C8Q71DRAFT_824894 [Rhodofomes roseus]KAH9830212.1 hypothetical protein C8Q71DRAFT_824894 [Rhodofomes roseus]
MFAALLRSLKCGLCGAGEPEYESQQGPSPQEQYQDPCIPQHEAVYSPAQPQRLPPPNPQPSPPPSPKPECPLPSAPTRKPERPPARPQPDLQAYPGPHKVHLCRGSSTSTQNLDHGPEIRNNSDYQALRARAIEEGSKMAQCFEASHTAYESGEHARAKELSTQGNAYKAEMKRLNELASEWIFAKKNKGRALGEVDLHGLYVREAIPCAECAVEDARRRGDTKINLIVGIGRHSPQGVAKLKPAIEEWLQRQGLVVELDPKNSGVLIVNLDGLPTGAGPVLSADEISRCFDS